MRVAWRAALDRSILLYLGKMDNVLGELCYGTRYLLIEMFGPDDLSGIVRHVADDERVSLLVVKDALNNFELTGIVGENCVVLEGIPLNRVLELLEKVDWLLDVFALAEIVVDELL
jgi:hypothetical protein